MNRFCVQTRTRRTRFHDLIRKTISRSNVFILVSNLHDFNFSFHSFGFSAFRFSKRVFLVRARMQFRKVEEKLHFALFLELINSQHLPKMINAILHNIIQDYELLIPPVIRLFSFFFFFFCCRHKNLFFSIILTTWSKMCADKNLCWVRMSLILFFFASSKRRDEKLSTWTTIFRLLIYSNNIFLSHKIGSTRFHFQEAINWILINRYDFPFPISRRLSIRRVTESCITLSLIETLII